MGGWTTAWVDKWRRITGCGWIDGLASRRVANVRKVVWTGEGEDEQINALIDG